LGAALVEPNVTLEGAEESVSPLRHVHHIETEGIVHAHFLMNFKWLKKCPISCQYGFPVSDVYDHRQLYWLGVCVSVLESRRGANPIAPWPEGGEV